MDATPAGARIVDYKTGKGTTEEKRLKDGLSVQLPVYQLAVRQAGDDGLRRDRVPRTGSSPAAAGSASCRLAGRRGGCAAGGCATWSPRRVALVDAGLFPRSTAGRCDYCDVGYACGATEWTRARKREHESLADLVSLQRHGPGEVSDDGGA